MHELREGPPFLFRFSVFFREGGGKDLLCSPVREAPRSSLFVEHVSRRWKNAFLLSAAMSLREPPESSGTEKVKYDLLVRISIGCAVHILLLTDFQGLRS